MQCICLFDVVAIADPEIVHLDNGGGAPCGVGLGAERCAWEVLRIFRQRFRTLSFRISEKVSRPAILRHADGGSSPSPSGIGHCSCYD